MFDKIDWKTTERPLDAEMSIRHLTELKGLENNIFKLYYSTSNKQVDIINKKTKACVETIKSLDEVKFLPHYGFSVEVKKLEKANLAVLEQISNENNLALIYKNGRWNCIAGGEITGIKSLLEDYGYYL